MSRFKVFLRAGFHTILPNSFSFKSWLIFLFPCLGWTFILTNFVELGCSTTNDCEFITWNGSNESWFSFGETKNSPDNSSSLKIDPLNKVWKY